LDRRLNRTLNCHRFTMLRYFRQRNLTMTNILARSMLDGLIWNNLVQNVELTNLEEQIQKLPAHGVTDYNIV